MNASWDSAAGRLGSIVNSCRGRGASNLANCALHYGIGAFVGPFDHVSFENNGSCDVRFLNDGTILSDLSSVWVTCP
jgi:hypothetical protein